MLDSRAKRYMKTLGTTPDLWILPEGALHFRTGQLDNTRTNMMCSRCENLPDGCAQGEQRLFSQSAFPLRFVTPKQQSDNRFLPN